MLLAGLKFGRIKIQLYKQMNHALFFLLHAYKNGSYPVSVPETPKG